MNRRLILTLAASATAVATGWWWQRGVDVASGLGPEVDAWLRQAPALLAIGARVPELGSMAASAEVRNMLGLSQAGEVALDAVQSAAREAIALAADRDELEEIDGWLITPPERLLGQLAVAVSSGRTAEAAQPEAEWDAAGFVEVDSWGPQWTEAGQPFNVQSDGHCGLWFRIRGAPAWARIAVDGEMMPTVVLDEVVTSGLYAELKDRVLANPGSYSIELIDPMQRRRQHIGQFEVRARPARWIRADGSESALFCPVLEWGPQQSVAGDLPNAQPDGSSGLWFKLECAPPAVQVELDGRILPTSQQPGLLTARVDGALFQQPGGHALALVDSASGERMPVGILRILPRMN